MISEEKATGREQNEQAEPEYSSRPLGNHDEAERKDVFFVYGVDRTYCSGSSTPLTRFRILCSTLNVRCLGPLGGFEKLWTAGPWRVEHVGGRGRQETAAGRGPLGALSMSISARSGATVGQVP